jgi:hypothetical protein
MARKNSSDRSLHFPNPKFPPVSGHYYDLEKLVLWSTHGGEWGCYNFRTGIPEEEVELELDLIAMALREPDRIIKDGVPVEDPQAYLKSLGHLQ